MVAFDENRGCEEAAAYYHDFLLDPSDPSIPGPVIDHLGACEHCRGQVRHWGEVLAEAEGEPGRTVADKALIAELQLHFEHLGRPLSCGQVKPLLPGLLIPSLRIRIPTPVTVHVDHCAECAADLATLRGLGLNSEQLTRLTRLYAEISAGDSRTCQKAQSRVGTLGSVSLEDVEDEVLRPLCICRKCRDRAYESRQEWLDGRRDRPDTGDICDSEISIADLFDYVVPNGRAGAEDSRARRQKGTGEHLRSCPRCLEKLQALHRAVYGIADRGDSNVATLYTTKPIDQEVPEDAENLYAGHPINVEVVHRTPDPLGEGSRFASGVRAALGRGFSNPVLRPLIRTAFLVAAMIPLAVVFRMSTRSASGLSIRQVNDIIAGAPAVHVTITYGNGTKPSEEVWISSAQKTFISQTSERTKVYDLQNGRKFFPEPGRSTTKPVNLSDKEFADIKRTIHKYLDFSFPNVSPNAELQRVVGDDGSAASEADEIFELPLPTMDSKGDPFFRRWTVYVDRTTRLPRRTTFCTKVKAEGPWELETTKEYDYPDPDEIRTRLEVLLSQQ